MTSPELKVPPLLLLAIAMAGVLTCHLVWPMQWPSLVTIVGILLSALGLICCVAGVVAFRRHATTVDPRYPENTGTLVTGGIYGYSRNPMYLGFALILVGWSAYLSTPFSLLWLVLFVTYLQRFQIYPEERQMRILFGQQFENYCRQTRRWLGRKN
ncbi:isoprenylcysteine carboxylmethyltransferase family protein [Alteromonas sp. ASW11-19]|uniref:Isoprenylcysteine carboxylmethyltransferase family protein n=1 Tax=Alteromonas salexigens TaxID=2982530 RepID=A0ABT2VRF4_9ALTE|nr:isoprenylcysteine carboxylmethyltransferase family protein [Alteromonas salexigens]MCU7555907.1 isoprenylcysteine carboxylmethyltransferase family protein [Alteromonas salexigens]